MEGATHKAVWLFIVLCWESVLTAFPTISLYYEGQSPGLPLEGIVLDTSDASFRRDTDRSVKWTTEPLDTVWYSPRFEQSDAAAPRIFRAAGAPSMGDSLHYVDADGTRSVRMSAWTQADARFASNTFWMDVTAHRNDGLLQFPPRQWDPYR